MHLSIETKFIQILYMLINYRFFLNINLEPESGLFQYQYTIIIFIIINCIIVIDIT